MRIDDFESLRPREPWGRYLPPLAMLGAVAMLLAAIAMPAAAGQGASEQQNQAGQPSAGADYSDDQLQSFAAASLRIEEINQEWVPKISSAESPEKSQAMRAKAVEQMTQAVRDEGLSLADYNGIYKTAQRDPEVAATIQEYRQDAR